MTASENPRPLVPGAEDGETLLSVENLRVTFHSLEGTFSVVNGVTITVRRGESVALVGETGCGKSVTLRAILGLLPTPPAQVSGRIRFGDRDLLAIGEAERRRLRGRQMSFIPQEPQASLNPVFTVGEQLIELIRWQGSDRLRPLRYVRGRYDAASRRARARALEMLAKVQIADPERILDAYPVQLSGGMAQRVLIAMALAGHPSILIADEPGTALDVTTQHAILGLLHGRIREEGLSLLYVTHNLGVAREMTERAYVMYAGDIVEVAPTEELFSRPEHPYTEALVQSVPHLTGEPPRGIEGMIPDYSNPPSGCRFHPRCPYVMPICYPEKPRFVDAGDKHRVLCTLQYEDVDQALVRAKADRIPEEAAE